MMIKLGLISVVGVPGYFVGLNDSPDDCLCIQLSLCLQNASAWFVTGRAVEQWQTLAQAST